MSKQEVVVLFHFSSFFIFLDLHGLVVPYFFVPCEINQRVLILIVPCALVGLAMKRIFSFFMDEPN